MKKSETPWGIVKVTRGPHKGRIGNYDDDSDDDKYALVFFGEMFYTHEYYLIPHSYLVTVSTSDLMNRHTEISMALTGDENMSADIRADLLSELYLIANELYHRMFNSRLTSGGKKSVFISHSSKDKQFARCLATDLTNVGYSPWLDEWQIKVGDSIPVKISEGVQSCDAVVVVLTEHGVLSKWVENEWQARYWDEINEGQIRVLPILLTRCEIPPLLKTKKYADFRHDYNKGLTSLLIALGNS